MTVFEEFLTDESRMFCRQIKGSKSCKSKLRSKVGVLLQYQWNPFDLCRIKVMAGVNSGVQYLKSAPGVLKVLEIVGVQRLL